MTTQKKKKGNLVADTLSGFSFYSRDTAEIVINSWTFLPTPAPCGSIITNLEL